MSDYCPKCTKKLWAITGEAGYGRCKSCFTIARIGLKEETEPEAFLKANEWLEQQRVLDNNRPRYSSKSSNGLETYVEAIISYDGTIHVRGIREQPIAKDWAVFTIEEARKLAKWILEVT